MKKFKKLTAIVLTMAMITVFTPIQGFADTILAQVEINDLNMDLYVTDHPDFDISIPSNPGYHLATQEELKSFGFSDYKYNYNGIWWKEKESGRCLDRNDTFKSDGKGYVFTIVLVEDPGYNFGFNIRTVFDGDYNTYGIRVDRYDEYVEIQQTSALTPSEYDGIVDSIEITDFEFPECGVKPDYELTIPENKYYHLASAEELKGMGEESVCVQNGVWWEDNQSKRRQAPDRGFLPGKERYKARIAIACEKNCKFGDNLKITINGETKEIRGTKHIGKDNLIIRTNSYNVEPGTITDFELGSGYYKTDENTYKVTATGDQILPEPLVKSKSGNLITRNESYRVTYGSEKIAAPGHYTVMVEGINGYTGTVIKNVIVTPEPVTGVKVRHSTATGGYDDAYLTWNPSKGVTGYQVYARRPSKTKKWTFLGRTQKTSFLKKNLYDGWKYEFMVYPYVECKDVRYRTMEDCSIVAMITLKKAYRPSAEKYSSVRVRISWKDIYGESGYQVRASRTGKTTYLRTTGKAMNIKVAKGKKYTYKVRAYKYVTKNGEKVRVYGPWSDSRTYTLK